MATYKDPTHAADQLLVNLYQTWELLAGTSYKLQWDNERCVANRSCTPHPLLRHPAHRPTSHIDLAPITVFNIFTPSAKIITSAVKSRSACLFRLWSKHTTSEGVRRRSDLSCMRRSYARKDDIVCPLWVIPKLTGLSSPSSLAASRAADCTVSRCCSVRMTALCGSIVRLMSTSSFLDSVQSSSSEGGPQFCGR